MVAIQSNNSSPRQRRGNTSNSKTMKWQKLCTNIALPTMIFVVCATTFKLGYELGIELAEPISVLISYEPPSADVTCSLYLAPSSVADGNNRPAGFGVFTVKPISKGRAIFPRGTGPVVPIVDVLDNIPTTVAATNYTPSFVNSIFMPKCIDFGIESDRPEQYTYNDQCYKSNNNVGSLNNFHPMLLSAVRDDPDEYQDDFLSRYRDPGAGAFSYYMGEVWRTSRYVEAGEEIFHDYGEHWFFDNFLHDFPKRTIPRKEHYLKAAQHIKTFINSHEEISQEDLDDFRTKVANATNLAETTKKLINLVIPDVDSVTQLVQSTKKYASESRVSSQQYGLARSIGIQSTLHRDIGWIKSNGRCLDNVYPKLSTIPQAGQGGFASRRIDEGEMVVPFPTPVQVTDRDDLNVYRHVYDEESDSLKPVGDAPYTKQLIVNYCFGHDDSSMLLCPATNANLINHCSNRTKVPVGKCNPATGPNAYIRWAVDLDVETSDWIKQNLTTIDERVRNGQRGLTMEVVALRPIEPNEEIFIDYGPSWEEAWERHVESWKPSVKDDGSFVSVSTMNEDVENYLLTKAEHDNGASYPHNNVRIGCYVEEFWHKCEIIDKSKGKDGSAFYSVKIRKWSSGGELGSGDLNDYEFPFVSGASGVVNNLSKDRIKFFAGPYSADQHLEGAFRHHIGVPEGMWPEQWMNRKGSNWYRGTS